MRDEANAWEYTRKEEERMARDDAIIADWIKREMGDRVAELAGMDLSDDVVEEIRQAATRQAAMHRQRIIDDWESTR